METPEEHNKQFLELYKPPEEWSRINLECPKCKTQLEVNNFFSLPSNPPQSKVRCPNPKCKYIGSIF